jgi:hypothetical protein
VQFPRSAVGDRRTTSKRRLGLAGVSHSPMAKPHLEGRFGCRRLSWGGSTRRWVRGDERGRRTAPANASMTMLGRKVKLGFEYEGNRNSVVSWRLAAEGTIMHTGVICNVDEACDPHFYPSPLAPRLSPVTTDLPSAQHLTDVASGVRHSPPGSSLYRRPGCHTVPRTSMGSIHLAAMLWRVLWAESGWHSIAVMRNWTRGGSVTLSCMPGGVHVTEPPCSGRIGYGLLTETCTR